MSSIKRAEAPKDQLARMVGGGGEVGIWAKRDRRAPFDLGHRGGPWFVITSPCSFVDAAVDCSIRPEYARSRTWRLYPLLSSISYCEGHP
jgi:hypothetical protein